jgi:cell division protein FtsB
MLRKLIKKIRETSYVIKILVLLLAYFLFHFIEGNRGLISYFEVTTELEQKKSDLVKLEKEVKGLENKVVLLRDGSIDPDMLEERAKSQLKLYSKDEFVVVSDKD